MNVHAFRDLLATHPGEKLHLMLPDKSFVPAHFHITEVGRVQKDFVDCGGTHRSSTTCLLQVWVTHDHEQDKNHRLDSAKLSQILKAAAPLLGDADMPVEFEFEDVTISQFPLGGAEVTPSGILFYLGTKHTACLAPEKCGVGSESSSCC